MTSTNKLTIDTRVDRELREYLAGKAVGDTCVFEVEAKLDEWASDVAIFSVKSIEADEEVAEPAESAEEQPSPGYQPSDAPKAQAALTDFSKSGNSGGAS